MRGRRWPIITIAPTAINLLAFLGTHWQIDQRIRNAAKSAHTSCCFRSHPELTMTAEVEEMVDAFRRDPEAWSQAQSPTRDLADAFERPQTADR